MKISHEHIRQALQRTPFHDRLVALSTTETWTGWNTYKVARVVDKLSSEYFAVRSGCAVMDLTPMEKYRITGSGAREFLDRLLTRDTSKLVPGRVTYGFDVSIEMETHDVAALAVQGPTSYSVLTAAGINGLDELKPFGIADLNCGKIPVTVSRTGYTGDLGYEVWMDPDDALVVWDAIFGVQGQYDVVAMGLDALEMVRIEAGFIMPGFDFNTAESTIRNGHDRSPYEVGLGWVVNLDKGHFTGRKALQAENKIGTMLFCVGCG